MKYEKEIISEKGKFMPHGIMIKVKQWGIPEMISSWVNMCFYHYYQNNKYP
jgi:hypothetical protein